MMPIVDELEGYYKGKIPIVKIDTELEPEKMKDYGVQVVPTFILFRQGQEVLRMSGLIGEKVLYERLNEKLK